MLDVTVTVKLDSKTLKALEDIMARLFVQPALLSAPDPVLPPEPVSVPAPASAPEPVLAPAAIVPPVATAPVAPVAPTAAPGYSFEDVAKAATAFISLDPSKNRQLAQEQLRVYGKQTLQELDADQRTHFAGVLRSWGVQI